MIYKKERYIFYLFSVVVVEAVETVENLKTALSGASSAALSVRENRVNKNGKKWKGVFGFHRAVQKRGTVCGKSVNINGCVCFDFHNPMV